MRLRAELLSLFFGVAFGNDGVFYNPPNPGAINDYSQNPIYQTGTQLQVRWSVSWDRISLTLWQNGNNDFEYLLPNVSNPNNYNWDISTDKDFSRQSGTNGTVFFLIGFNPGTNDQFSSHYFNLTAGSSAASSSAAAATTEVQPVVVVTVVPSGTSGDTSTTNSAGILAAATSGGDSSAPAESTGLSSTAKLGLGVGIGVGVPLLVLVGVALGFGLRAWFRKDENHAPAIPYGPEGAWMPPPGQQGSDQKIVPPNLYPPAGYQSSDEKLPYQAQPARYVQELSATRDRDQVYELASEGNYRPPPPRKS